jgi:hypothetical protein
VPATVAQGNMVNPRSSETALTQSTISGTSLGSFATAPTRAAATDPCAGNLAQRTLVRSTRNRGGTAPQGTCPNPALRVWRDLPNSGVRN